MNAPPMSTPGLRRRCASAVSNCNPTSAACSSTARRRRSAARAFDLLLALAERPGQLVGKHALMDLVWPGLVVQENNLAAQVSALRKVLGDDVIATIPGRGYRFVARARRPQPAAPDRRRQRRPVAAPRRAGAAHATCRAELPALLGRADELAALGALIDATPAGQRGRRRRHRQVAARAAPARARRRDAYPHGVCWVELAQRRRCGRPCRARSPPRSASTAATASRWPRWWPRWRR